MIAAVRTLYRPDRTQFPRRAADWIEVTGSETFADLLDAELGTCVDVPPPRTRSNQIPRNRP